MRLIGTRDIDIWDLKNKRLAALLKRDDFREVTPPIDALAYSPDGKYLVAGGGFGIKFWDISSQQCIYSDKYEHCINALAISPCGKYLAVGLLSGLLKIVDMENKQTIFQILHEDSTIFHLAFSPCGTSLACGLSHTIKIYKKKHFALLSEVFSHNQEESNQCGCVIA